MTVDDKIDAVMVILSLACFAAFAVMMATDPYERAQFRRVIDAAKNVQGVLP